MTKAVWKTIVQGWIVAGAALLAGRIQATGIVPTVYATPFQAQLTAGALALVSAAGTLYLAARAKLEAEARAQLPPTADWATVELRMGAIGFRRLLFALRQPSEHDPRLDGVTAEILDLKARVEELEATVRRLADQPSVMNVTHLKSGDVREVVNAISNAAPMSTRGIT